MAVLLVAFALVKVSVHESLSLYIYGRGDPPQILTGRPGYSCSSLVSQDLIISNRHEWFRIFREPG